MSAGGENGAVLDYNIKSTHTGMDQPHADAYFFLFFFVCVFNLIPTEGGLHLDWTKGVKLTLAHSPQVTET